MAKREGAGRTGRRWRELKAAFRAECEANNAPCWMDGQPIDYAAGDDMPDSFTVDHFHPVSTHPELGNDPANLRPAHRACNLARGNGEAPLSLGSLSEDW
ncbi:HNH endonuclease [Rhodococcus pyridinivorans]|nr:HNH endonuclease [Rhodococcus pyridinivorans]